MRVLTYNIRSLRDDRSAVVAVVRATRPDVLCIQELPRFLRWRSRAAALARDCGLLYVCGGRPTGGTALFAATRVDVVATLERPLTRTPTLHQRGVAAALVRVAGRPAVVAAVHLGLDATERVRHATEVRDALAPMAAETGAALVVAGDFNERPGEPAWQRIGEGLADAVPGDGPTYSATDPRRKIDTVFADPRIVVRSGRALDGPAVRAGSDHRPVLADLTLPAP